MKYMMIPLLDAMPTFLKSKWALGALALLVLGGGYWLFAARGGALYQFITVTKGSLTEMVSATGNTVPMKNVSLGFQNSGTIAHVYYNLGDQVHAGDVIATLNTASLGASLQQAQATVDAQQAQLDNLKAGSEPVDIAASQAALDKAKQDLANLYASINDVSLDSYAKANDAVRTELNQLFTNGDTSSARLTYDTANFEAQNSAQTQRVSVTALLNAWQTELAAANKTDADLAAFSQKEISYLAAIQQLLGSVSATLASAPGLNAATLTTYKANVSIAINEVNLAMKNLNALSQSIASQQATVAQAQAQLALKQEGPTVYAIAAQQAQVAQAEAGVASVEANLQGSRIVAPISGVLTQLDAKVGQLASPGTPLVSIIGNGGFEVDTGVSDTDVGKLAIGDTVSMTIDAFPNETFAGTVFYIAPAETNTQGVISYQVKISFDKLDPRLKSGLTANVEIKAKQRDNVLILPQYAILQNNAGTFVETLAGKTVLTHPVTLGIQDQNGNVEILSGVTPGEQVINIGLKAK
ncbi:MAG: efflux RND transporter periplasmic adaptor subunit [Minisyncoccota bacterium]